MMFGHSFTMSNVSQRISAEAPVRAAIPPMAYLLTACIGVIGSNSLALGPIAPEVARALVASVPAVMAAAAAFGLGTAAGALTLARHVDRFGPVFMLRAALLVLVVGLAASALSPSVLVLTGSQFITGLAAGVALPAIYTLAAVIAPPGRESETIGVVLTGWTLSMVAGVSLSAVLADYLDWRAVYGLVAGLALCALAALSLSGLRDQPAVQSAPSPFAALAVPGVRPLLLACAAFMASFYGVYGYLGDHLNAELGRPVSAGALITLAYGLGFGGAAFFDGAIDRLGARRVMPLAFLSVGAIYAAMALASSSYGLLVGIAFLWGLAVHCGLNALIVRLMALDPARRGAIMGLNSGATYLALFAGTTGFGPLYAAFGIRAPVLAAMALMLFAVVVAQRAGASD